MTDPAPDRRPQQGLAVASPPPRCSARPATASATTPRSCALVDPENGVEFFYLRPRDIALYVGEGTLDVGITGRDLLLDSGAKAEEVLALGFGRSRPSASPARPGRYTDLDRPRRPADRHVVRRGGAARSSTSAASTRP